MKKTALAALVVALVFALGVLSGWRLGDTSPHWPSVYENTQRAVLSLQDDAGRGLGNAFHVGGGVYATAAHVVAGRGKVAASWDTPRLGKSETRAMLEVIGVDVVTDVAVLRGPARPQVLLWGKDAKVGEAVLAFGNPNGEAPNSVVLGVVSGKHRLGIAAQRPLAGLLQIDASLHPGDSGAPVLNANGEVIGMVSATLSQGGMGFAVPARVVRRTLEGFKNGRITREGFGAGFQTERFAVLSTDDAGFAARAGIKPNDVVLRVAGVLVETPAEIAAVLAVQEPGEVKIAVLRAGQTLELQAKLERP